MRKPGALAVVRLVCAAMPMLAVAGCGSSNPDDTGASPDAGSDASPGAADAAVDPLPAQRVLYTFDRRHSPITPELVDRLAAVGSTATGGDLVFAKVGDSMSADREFLHCFDGGIVDLGDRAALASTIDHYMAGNAAGLSPFRRNSAAAYNGATAETLLAGTPPPLDEELAAIAPRLAVIMIGTNDIRRGGELGTFAANLWRVTERALANGTIPLLSTIPANTGDPWADVQIPRTNLAIRGIAQGLQVPFVDLHRALSPLPNRGISSDGVHLSVAPGGGCLWTSDGLQHGYNTRNLVTIEQLNRLRSALAGTASDPSAPTLAGAGLASDPFVVPWPFADIGDTRDGEALVGEHGCTSGRAQPGKELVYELTLPSQVRLHAQVITRDGTAVDVHVLAGGTCRASGDNSVIVTVGPGTIQIVVDTPVETGEGEFLLVPDRGSIRRRDGHSRGSSPISSMR